MKDNIHIAPESDYNKSIAPITPLSRMELRELIGLFREARSCYYPGSILYQIISEQIKLRTEDLAKLGNEIDNV